MSLDIDDLLILFGLFSSCARSVISCGPLTDTSSHCGMNVGQTVMPQSWLREYLRTPGGLLIFGGRETFRNAAGCIWRAIVEWAWGRHREVRNWWDSGMCFGCGCLAHLVSHCWSGLHSWTSHSGRECYHDLETIHLIAGDGIWLS